MIHFVFTVPEMLAVVRKGGKMTLYEKADLDTHLAILAAEPVFMDGIEVSDAETLAFVRHVLPPAIRNDVPKLAEMMRLFGIEMDAVFTFKTQRF
jgi:hypothetical protein